MTPFGMQLIISQAIGNNNVGCIRISIFDHLNIKSCDFYRQSESILPAATCILTLEILS